jgi:hypothetical protein
VSPGGEEVGALLRNCEALAGTLTVVAEPAGDGLFRLTVTIANRTPWDGSPRERTLRRTFCSTHTVLEAHGAEFVSLMDPPERHREAAEACRNAGTWPVLLGAAGERTRMLSSPIILYDHPQVAPESPGDLFDGGEIDQMLILNLLTLTEDEQAEMRATDPRAREILDRCAGLTQEQLMRLHGAIREFRPAMHP